MSESDSVAPSRAGGWRATTIILDSTEITRDWFLRGLDFRLLPSLRERSGTSTEVPASVVAETLANYERSVEDLQRALNRLGREDKRLGLPFPSELSEQEESYADRLNDAFERLRISVLPWPQVSHEKLVQRATSRTPPFSPNGSGYRDSLVWEAVLEVGEPSLKTYKIMGVYPTLYW